MDLSKSTTDLLNYLQTIHTKSELDDYLKHHTSNALSFVEYFNIYLDKHSLPLAEVVAKSGLEKHYAYQIINGTKANPGRMKILALCLGASMNLKDTQRCLELTKNAPLYPKDTRDAIIITHINLNERNINKINDELWEHHLETIN